MPARGSIDAMLGRALLLLLLPLAARGQDLTGGYKPIPFDKWGGLNLTSDSTQIGFDCQYCSNVLTENGYLEKRPGNVLLTTVLPGYAVTYASDWVSPSGSRYLVMQASNTIYQTNFSAVPVALSTIAAGYNLTTAAGFSKLFFADGSRPLWQWDGTSTSTVQDFNGNNAPTCTYVAFKDSRLFCANLAFDTQPGDVRSRVRISSALAGNYWNVPYNVALIDNAPNVFDFDPSNGDYITCLVPTPWGMFIGKRNSSYILKGNGNLSYDARILDPRIGCVDNRTAQMVYGSLVWLGMDGIYAYNGAGSPQLISRELDPLIKQVRALTYSEGQWSTIMQPDWATGTESTTTGNAPALPWDYADVPTEIFPSSFTLYDNNRGASQVGQMGFSSDTLVNIDTTSVPLNTGYAQISPPGAGGSGQVNPVNADWLSATVGGSMTWIVASGNWSSITGGVENYTSGNTTDLDATIKSTATAYPGEWEFSHNINGTGGIGSTSNYCSRTHAVDAGCLMVKLEDSLGHYYALRLADGPSVSLSPMYAEIVKNTGSGDVYLSQVTTSYSINSSHRWQIQISRDNSASPPTNVIRIFEDGTLLTSAADPSQIAISAREISGSSSCFFSACSEGRLDEQIINWKEYQYASSGTITSRIFDTGQAVPLAGAVNSSYTLTTDGATSLAFKVRASSSPNNDFWTAWTTYANSQRAAALDGQRYWQFEADFATTVASETPKLQSMQIVGVTTGYYYSKVNYLGSGMTAWKQLGISETNPGTYGYAVRSATYAFPAGNYALAWTTQSANTNITVSTGTYAQFRLDSTVLTSADQAEPISSVFLRWAQGQNIPLASAALDRRYMLCLAISTGVSTPDTCLLRGKNGKWSYWKNGASNLTGALGQYNYNIVAVDGSTSSKVWSILQPGIYEDDGNPIDMVWVSADLTDGLPFNTKTLYEAWLDACAVQGSSVTWSYALDKSPTWTDKVVSLDAPGAPSPTQWPLLSPQTAKVNKWLPLLAGSVNARYLRFKLEDANLNSYSRVNSLLLYVKDQPRQTP